MVKRKIWLTLLLQCLLLVCDAMFLDCTWANIYVLLAFQTLLLFGFVCDSRCD
jgi:hypothetical protein